MRIPRNYVQIKICLKCFWNQWMFYEKLFLGNVSYTFDNTGSSVIGIVSDMGHKSIPFRQIFVIYIRNMCFEQSGGKKKKKNKKG